MSVVFNDLVESMKEFIDYEKGQKQLTVKNVEITPVEEIAAQTIKDLRESFSMSQAVFAEIIGVSKKTVEAWEAGRNKPNGPSLRMMQVIKSKPEIIESIYIYR